MFGYIVRRLLALVPVLIGITFLVFLILHLAPGDPALIILGPKANATSLAQMRHELGLDQPFLVQYFLWIGRVLQGDWGRSIQMKREVLPLVLQRFQASAFLTLLATIIAVVVGTLVGITSATRQYSVWDRLSMVGVLVGFSIPVFWLGIMLQILFAVTLGILPVAGMQSATETGFLDMLRHSILPSITLATGATVIIARMTRSSMLEVLSQDYVRTARAKGVRENMVIYQHTLRNALISVITVVGLQVGYLLGGDILVEIVFSWPGIGLLMMNGIAARDFPIVQGAVLLVATSYVMVNLVVDVLYAFVDPRIHYQ